MTPVRKNFRTTRLPCVAAHRPTVTAHGRTVRADLPLRSAEAASLVNRIKSHAAYTTADGEALKIEGAEQTGPDPETTKPVIKVVLVSGGQKEVQWKKLGFTALKIEVDRGNGQFVYLATDTEPHYIDTVSLPPGTAAVWRYRAIYLDGDQLFGQWSDVVSIAVTG